MGGGLDHTISQHLVGAVHTNTIEGFWSLIKRGVVGTYHQVSRKYLPLYVAEFEFRHNNLNNPDIFGAAVGRCCDASRAGGGGSVLGTRKYFILEDDANPADGNGATSRDKPQNAPSRGAEGATINTRPDSERTYDGKHP